MSRQKIHSAEQRAEHRTFENNELLPTLSPRQHNHAMHRPAEHGQYQAVDLGARRRRAQDTSTFFAQIGQCRLQPMSDAKHGGQKHGVSTAEAEVLPPAHTHTNADTHAYSYASAPRPRQQKRCGEGALQVTDRGRGTSRRPCNVQRCTYTFMPIHLRMQLEPQNGKTTTNT